MCIICKAQYYKDKNNSEEVKNKLAIKYADPEYQKRGAERWKKADAKIKSELYSIIHEYKNHPCKDCGVSYPYYVMDFDHLNGEEKLFNISKIGNFKGKDGKKKLIAEIQKCEVVCSNCHRERTHERKELSAQTKETNKG